jgi:hypothetical protein
MSDTKKVKYTKHRIRGRANEYGLCVCAMCRSGRNSSNIVIKAKHRARTAWKSGKKIIKGIYTD